jgi:DNA-binding LacI/PurR family transcriptional regulator
MGNGTLSLAGEVLAGFACDANSTAAKHAQLSDFLRARLADGFADGDRFFTERELIEQVGLSQPTVRTAMRTLTRDGLLDVRPRQGVFVRKPGVRPCIGVAVVQCNSPIMLRLLDELGGESARHGMVMQLFHTHQGTQFAEVAATIGHTERVRGIVLVGEQLDFTLEAHAHFEKAGIPSVSLGWTPEDAPGSCVAEDHTVAGRLTFDHLETLGHRRVAVLITNPLIGGPIIDRVNCFKAEAARRPHLSVTFIDCDIPPSGDIPSLVGQRMPRIMALRPRPTAVVGISDWGALAVLKFCQENGVRVPEDLAVMGYDDMPMAAVIDPGLSTIAKPYHAMAARAVKWLAGGAKAHMREFCEPHLVVRGSTDPTQRMT